MATKAKTGNMALKVVALAGMTIGAITIAQAMRHRFKRKQDEAEIEEMVVATENFSGMGGKMPTYQGMRKLKGLGSRQEIFSRGGASARGTRKFCHRHYVGSGILIPCDDTRAENTGVEA